MCATCGMPFAGAAPRPSAPVSPAPAPTPTPTPVSAPVAPRAVAVAVTGHQPFIAVLLGVIFWWLPGLAHVYNRQWSKAGLYFGIQILPIVLLFVLATVASRGSGSAAGWVGAAAVLSWVLALGAGLVSVLDAMLVARRHQEGDFVGVWTFF